jgi:NADH-quinone oxidoreductase subunit E
MSWEMPADLEAEIDELITHYPQRRSASLMVLHAIQERLGWISPEATAWAATKLGLQPIHIQELVTFYPMFRQAPAGRHQFKVCRTLSCALAGGHRLHHHLCERFHLDPHDHGLQTTADGQFSVEYVECLAGCGTAPVLMMGEAFHEGVTPETVDRMIADITQGSSHGAEGMGKVKGQQNGTGS